MKFRVCSFRIGPFRMVAKRLALLIVGAVMFLGLFQTAVYAAPVAEPSSASGDPLQPPSPESLERMRAQRREFQSKASRAANDEKKADSGSEVLTEKLNLDEIVEENKIVEGIRKSLD
ncbi:hypothetical protein [Leptolyngbya sp. BC1307]|uniref:hypothetical protein n=1 Tax=Leptolyngbya sp. BC1307 TaxID=2029589 RepID=UPI001140EAC9|nr:hypothetical protein [Leptolyngbya sp. BC1307]